MLATLLEIPIVCSNVSTSFLGELVDLVHASALEPGEPSHHLDLLLLHLLLLLHPLLLHLSWQGVRPVGSSLSHLDI